LFGESNNLIRDDPLHIYVLVVPKFTVSDIGCTVEFNEAGFAITISLHDCEVLHVGNVTVDCVFSIMT
jgi:hypothetical protein